MLHNLFTHFFTFFDCASDIQPVLFLTKNYAEKCVISPLFTAVSLTVSFDKGITAQ